MSAAAICLHGALMSCAWPALAPRCIFVARYLKVRRGWVWRWPARSHGAHGPRSACPYVFIAAMIAGEAAGWRVPTHRAIWGQDLGKTPPS